MDSQLSEQFLHEGFVQLRDYLSLTSYKQLGAVINRVSLKQYFKPLYGKYKYSKLEKTFFESKEFLTFLESITKQKLSLVSVVLYVYSSSDYTLLRDDVLDASAYTLIYELTPVWSELFGGYTRFVSKEDYMTLQPHRNSLTILKTEGMKSFVKYVNHLGARRVFLCASFAVV